MILIRAIIIDDETDSAEVFAEFLKIKNIDVVGLAKNGLDGVSLYRQHEPDVVFSDLVMPKYDGFYAISEIKKINPDAKVVIITAYYTDLMKKQLDNLGITDIFQKPYSVTEITKMLVEKIKT